MTGWSGVADIAVVSLRASLVCLGWAARPAVVDGMGWDGRSLLCVCSCHGAGGEPGAAFGPTGTKAAARCSGLCRVGRCPLRVPWQRERFLPPSLFCQGLLREKLVFPAALDLQAHSCPVNGDTPTPGHAVPCKLGLLH